MHRLIDIDSTCSIVRPPPPPPVVFFFKSNSDVNGSVNGACDDVIKRDKQACVISELF